MHFVGHFDVRFAIIVYGLHRFSVPQELSALEEDETWMKSFLQLVLGCPDPDLWRGLKVNVVVPPTEGVVL